MNHHQYGDHMVVPNAAPGNMPKVLSGRLYSWDGGSGTRPEGGGGTHPEGGSGTLPEGGSGALPENMCKFR